MRRAVLSLVVGLAAGLGCAAAGRANDPAPASPADRLVAELQALMDGHTDREEERRIVELLRTCEGPVLDAALRRIDLDELLGDVDDHLGGPQRRSELLVLLSKARLAHLSVAARAALVSALQRGRTGEADERAIADVFLGTRGADLTALKNAVDEGGDHRDLEQLVFHDIDDEELRARILEHIAREAAAAPSGELKVMSDIDDTIFCNWVDERFPAKAVYPGVRALYRELDLGPDGVGRPGDIVFLTARPGDRMGVVEGQTLGTLRDLGVPRCVVLTGSLLDVTSNEAIARGKLENFGRYRRLFPEYGYVFMGDSGQGDAFVAAAMVAEHADVTRAVFIHDVAATSAEGRARWAAKGVPFFDTYVGAALHAHERGLIATAGLARIARAARAELDAIAFDDDAVRQARRAELARDLERANALLPERDRVR